MKLPLPALAFALALASALPLSLRAEDETVDSDETGMALDRAVQMQTDSKFWGVILVAREGKVLLAKGYGDADYKKISNTPRSLFEIASTSKMFTAIAILKLESQGKLTTADPISKYFKGVPEDKKAITIQHLLNHTSGMTGDGLLPYQCEETADQLVALAMATKLSGAVGEKFGYSNVGYSLLAVIIEKASGQAFETYMRESLFKPAGLKDTGFLQDKSLDARRATVRMNKDTQKPVGTAIEWGWSWGYRGMGGIVTTAYDLLRFDRAMRGDGILDAAAKKKEMTPALDGYGCGCLVQTTSRGTTKIQHAGSVAGYLCNYIRFIDDDAVIIILSNQDCDLAGVEKAIAEELFAPVKIKLEIDVKGRELNKSGGLVLKEGAKWKAARSPAGVVLSVETKTGAPLRATLPPEAASGIVKMVQASIEARTRSGEKDDGSLEIGIYTLNLELTEGHCLINGAGFSLQEEYKGVDADNKPVSDKRMLLIFDDPESGQWPLMAHMSLTAATNLVKELKSALEK